VLLRFELQEMLAYCLENYKSVCILPIKLQEKCLLLLPRKQQDVQAYCLENYRKCMHAAKKTTRNA
jgi:hypothetical protein